MNYKYTYLSQIQLNKLLFHQTNTLNDGIALDKLIGMQLLPDNDSIVDLMRLWNSLSQNINDFNYNKTVKFINGRRVL